MSYISIFFPWKWCSASIVNSVIQEASCLLLLHSWNIQHIRISSGHVMGKKLMHTSLLQYLNEKCDLLKKLEH